MLINASSRVPGMVLIAGLLLCTSAHATEAIQAGIYEIVAETVMPHLEENLRYATTRERHCLNGRDLPSIFPVLQHPSLRGCTLGDESAGADSIRYRLICERPEAPTGTARLNAARDRIVGFLQIKLGGKNMTMSQRIRATWQGACEADE